MRVIKSILISALLVGGVLAVLPASEAMAVNVFDQACQGAGGGSAICANKSDDASSMVAPIVSTLLMIVGVVGVIVLIIGGILYITSTGDAAKVKRAKDTILYAIVGIVIAILAYAIVEFVIGRL